MIQPPMFDRVDGKFEETLITEDLKYGCNNKLASFLADHLANCFQSSLRHIECEARFSRPDIHVILTNAHGALVLQISNEFSKKHID